MTQLKRTGETLGQEGEVGQREAEREVSLEIITERDLW